MRILHVCETAKGGVGSYLNEIVPLQIQDYGEHSVHILLPKEHRGQIPNAPERCVTTFARPRRSVVSVVALERRFKALNTEWNPDIVHAHSTFAGLITRLFRVGSRGMVYCPHGWSFDIETDPLFKGVLRRAERALSPLADRIIAVSEHEAKIGAWAGIDRSRLVVVPNGISATPPDTTAAEWNDNRIKVLFIGRLDRQKGFDILAQAAATMNSEITVRVAGEGVTSRRDSKSTQSNIHFLGWLTQNEIQSHLISCDVVVIPSRWEAQGLVALEAMRAARPIIASAVGGLAETVVDGVTGRLVPPNDVEALAAALRSDTAADRIAMGMAGRRRFLERYDVRRTHAQLTSLYRRLMRTDDGAGVHDAKVA